MKRLAKHPVVRKDAMFRSFIQDKEVSKTLKPVTGFKSAIDMFKLRMNLFRARLTVTERDVWFKVSTSNHGLRTPREELAFTARLKIHSQVPLSNF
jgi:hypothetical protein